MALGNSATAGQFVPGVFRCYSSSHTEVGLSFTFTAERLRLIRSVPPRRPRPAHGGRTVASGKAPGKKRPCGRRSPAPGHLWASLSLRRTSQTPGLPAHAADGELVPVGRLPAVLRADGSLGVAVRGHRQDDGDGGVGCRFNRDLPSYVAALFQPLGLLHRSANHREGVVTQGLVAQVDLLP